MRIYLRNGDKESGFYFPLSAIGLADALDRMNVSSGSTVTCKFPNFDFCNLPRSILDRYQTTDIYKLNMFIERYEQLENFQKSAFKSIIESDSHCSIDDMLLMTYGINSVAVFPCYSETELGKIAVENGMLEELKDMPKEHWRFLDYQKIGKEVIDKGVGVMAYNCFCKPKDYRRPEINIEITVPERSFFRMLAAPSAQDMDKAQWISLPQDIELLNDMSEEYGMPIDELYYTKVESALPTINEYTYKSNGWLADMIRLSKELAELPHHKFVKLKAVMEAEGISVLGDVSHAIDSLNEYNFDPMVQDESQFGQAYASRIFPTNFDCSMIEDCDMHDFGLAVLRRKDGIMTEYGALAGRGQKLYTTLTVEQEQTEDETEEEDILEYDEI